MYLGFYGCSYVNIIRVVFILCNNIVSCMYVCIIVLYCVCMYYCIVLYIHICIYMYISYLCLCMLQCGRMALPNTGVENYKSIN